MGSALLLLSEVVGLNPGPQVSLQELYSKPYHQLRRQVLKPSAEIAVF